MLNLIPDADGLNDRQLVDFPPERELLLDELVVPMPSDTPNLEQISKNIADNHEETLTYTLEEEAYATYREAHDKLVAAKLRTSNENAQGILSKARGYVARIAMIIHCLEQSLQSEVEEWETKISPRAVKVATAVVEHFNKQKFIMLGVSTQIQTLSSKVAHLLTMSSKSGNGIIIPTKVSQKHIYEKVGASYPTSTAIESLIEAESLGYGMMQDVLSPNKRTVRQFRK